MKAKFFWMRAAVIAVAVCGLVGFARYSLSAIFAGGFFAGDEIPFIDRGLVLLVAGGAAIGVVAVEAVSRIKIIWTGLFPGARAKLQPDAGTAGAYTVDSVRPNFGV
jgi:hypothetical protein